MLIDLYLHFAVVLILLLFKKIFEFLVSLFKMLNAFQNHVSLMLHVRHLSLHHFFKVETFFVELLYLVFKRFNLFLTSSFMLFIDFIYSLFALFSLVVDFPFQYLLFHVICILDFGNTLLTLSCQVRFLFLSSVLDLFDLIIQLSNSLLIPAHSIFKLCDSLALLVLLSVFGIFNFFSQLLNLAFVWEFLFLSLSLHMLALRP